MALCWFSCEFMWYGIVWCRRGHTVVQVPYRQAPVPGVHKRRRGKCYRRVKTTNELRQNCGDAADGYLKYVRKARCKGNIPTAYDDILLS